MTKLILFDIDGTLLSSDGAGKRAIRAALLAESGTAGPIDDGYRLDGKTDPQIVRELLAAARHAHAHAAQRVAAVCQRYLSLLERELAVSAGRSRTYPGVSALLDLIERRSDAVLGLLTGNLAEGAQMPQRSTGNSRAYPAYRSRSPDVITTAQQRLHACLIGSIPGIWSQ